MGGAAPAALGGAHRPGSRPGGTSARFGGAMAMDPCDFLVVHPTDDNASRWSKLKLSPMLKGTASLRGLFPEKSRDGSNSVLLKEHRDGLGAILISGANSPSSLSQVTMPPGAGRSVEVGDERRRRSGIAGGQPIPGA